MITFDDCAAHIHVAAYHAAAPQFKSFTPGIGILCRSGDVLGGVSLLSNSRGMPAGYAFGGYQPLHVGSVRVGAIAGLRTKEQFAVQDDRNWTWNPNSPHVTKMAPIAGAVVSYAVKPGHEVHAIIMPRIPLVTPATVAVSYSWKWK